MVIKMVVHKMLRNFDLTKVSVKDFRGRFELYCMINKLKGKGDIQRLERPYLSHC